LADRRAQFNGESDLLFPVFLGGFSLAAAAADVAGPQDRM